MYLKTIKIKNGYDLVNYVIYKCNICDCEIEEAHPKYQEDNNYHLCVECAFKGGKVDEKFYLSICGIYLSNLHAGINLEGNIEIWQGNKTPPWKRNKRSQRNSPKYKEWRKEVFKRDNHTCRYCKQIGGNLNAHHIKSFSKYKKLRLKIDNGLTLCEKCHKESHRKKVSHE